VQSVQPFRIVSRAHSTAPQPLHLAREFGDAVQLDLRREAPVTRRWSSVRS